MMLFAISAAPLYAEDALSLASLDYRLNTLWLLIASVKIFLMHLGFATLESGLTRAKNTVNILFKNLTVLALGILGFTLCGYSFMFQGDPLVPVSSWFGFAGWGAGDMSGALTLNASGNYEVTRWSFLLFQAMFAATCATIVSGAVAERIKLSAFLIFSFVYVSVVYPVLGSWTWGQGWLHQRGFTDFAGSTVVHSVGGWAALAGAIFLGPRLGKYVNSTTKPMIGHSLPLATLGVFMLWFGWYGFNGGSVFSRSPELLSQVFVVTTLSASAGLFTTILLTWLIQGKPDLTMMLNGALGGLVGVTAGANLYGVSTSLWVGIISGALVVTFIPLFDKLRVDDPVGALSVHLVCGVWGTLAVGVFSSAHSLGVQFLGVFTYGAAAFASASVLFLILRSTSGLRVSEEEELAGLDLGEHGMEAYTGFQIFTTQ
ncbi:MAG: ammonium transporter [Kiritimatiellae bacterium]|nr:ammonium transporter [Kiritimatiellia bacterium]